MINDRADQNLYDNVSLMIIIVWLEVSDVFWWNVWGGNEWRIKPETDPEARWTVYLTAVCWSIICLCRCWRGQRSSKHWHECILLTQRRSTLNTMTLQAPPTAPGTSCLGKKKKSGSLHGLLPESWPSWSRICPSVRLSARWLNVY